MALPSPSPVYEFFGGKAVIDSVNYIYYTHREFRKLQDGFIKEEREWQKRCRELIAEEKRSFPHTNPNNIDFLEISIESSREREKRHQHLIKRMEMNKMKWQYPEKKIELDIERARAVPLTDLIKVERSGYAKCPFHNEKTASFKYYAKQNKWHCFGCNEGGSVIDFVMKQQNLSFVQAVKFLLQL